MPTLPDLQTTLISTLCYFDAGVVIKKSDVLPILESFTEYDNGVDGIMSFTFDGTRITSGTRIRLQVRIRTDGMVYAYGLRADEFKTGSVGDSTAASGPQNWQRALLPVSGFGNTAPSAQDTLLFRAIQQLVNVVTTPGKNVPNVGTVNYYDFEFTTTGNIYVFGTGVGAGTNQNNSTAWQFTQPVGLSLFLLAWRCPFSGSPGTGNTASVSFSLNGTGLFSASFSSSTARSGVAWSGRQGASMTSVLTTPGNQNNAVSQAQTGGVASGSSGLFPTFVVYASA